MAAGCHPASVSAVPLILLTAALIFIGLAPAVVNGDGLGYLRAAAHGGSYAGHLGYLPLLRMLPGARPVEILPWARALSVMSGVGALAAFGAAAKRMRLQAPLAATAGLGASFAVLAAASDVECYAPALACLCLALYFLARRWEGAAALAAAAAALIHVENLLFALPLFFACRRRSWSLVPLCAVGAALWVSRLSPFGASHGFHYPLRAVTPAVALYGAARTLVYSPYPYEASWPRVVGCFVVGAAALAALGTLVRRGGAPLGRAVTLAWLVPYAAVGVAFFPSDPERWIFLLPLAWLSVAAAARARATFWLAGALTCVNLALWLPRAADDSWRRRAEAAGAHLQSGDLVISPGHGWDEYVGFWSGPPGGGETRPFPLVYYAGALGGRVPLAARIVEERSRAPRTILLRGSDDGDPMGWKELVLFGITPADLSSLVPGERVGLGDGVAYLRPSGGATPSRN
jgi:hypothetical protein